MEEAEDGTVGLQFWGNTACKSWIIMLHNLTEIISDVLQKEQAGKRLTLGFWSSKFCFKSSSEIRKAVLFLMGYVCKVE